MFVLWIPFLGRYGGAHFVVFVSVANAGHSMYEKGIMQQLIAATEELKWIKIIEANLCLTVSVHWVDKWSCKASYSNRNFHDQCHYLVDRFFQ